MRQRLVTMSPWARNAVVNMEFRGTSGGRELT